MSEQEKPQEVCYAVEFDDYGVTQPGRVEVRHENYGFSVHLRTANGEFELLTAPRDQFGVFLTWGNRVTAAQEDGTRSCIDAVILALQFVQRQCAITIPPTVVVDTTKQPQGPAEQKAAVPEQEKSPDFLKLMRAQAMRAIMQEEDRKFLEWVNSQPVAGAVAEQENNNDFSRLMHERAVSRDMLMLQEGNRKFLEGLNSQPVVDAAAPAVVFTLNPERFAPGPMLATIGQQVVTMGEGNADVAPALCSIHGEQPNIAGYCDGGYQTISVCLKCCAEIYHAWSETQAAKVAVRPTLDTVWQEIQRLISVNARHRSGFTMQECNADKTLVRAGDEFAELMTANAAAQPMELGDTVAVLLYYAHCLGLTQHDLAELMLEKFKIRFTEG